MPLKIYVLAFIITILSSMYVYADNSPLQSDNSLNVDNTTTDNNTTDNDTFKLNIKPKLVPDRLINDKNSFMKDFGFPTREEFKIRTDFTAKDKGLYDDVEITLKNRWSTTNMWGKDKLYIEGILSGGIFGFNYYSIQPSRAEQKEYILPYGAIYLKLMSGTIFSPEITIKDSRFIFSDNKITFDESATNYNFYQIKLPLGFRIPFFGWKAEMYLDGSYSSLNNNFKVKDNLMVNGMLLQNGASFHSTSVNWNVRLYLDTPVVLKPSISEYAYFGIFYDEVRSARTATAGNDYENGEKLLVDGIARTGGIFYDMRLNVYKGFMFGINVYVGVTDIESSNLYDVKYGNSEGLVAYKAEITLGYQYIFKKYGVGLGFDAGVSYEGFIEFFYGHDASSYSLTLDGDLRYFAELKFIFGY